MNKIVNKVAIIGFGRFGKTLYGLLRGDFAITLYDKNNRVFDGLILNNNDRIAKTLGEVFKCKVIFYAVPISKFEAVVKSHLKYLSDFHIIIDVLSVKIHPKKVLSKLLGKSKIQALLTHPMFGPDSSKNGFKGLKIVIDKFRSSETVFNFWKNYFGKKGLKVIEMSAVEHDKIAANSQTLAHFIGRALEKMKHQKSEIDTKGARLLAEIMDMTTHDSRELFYDMNKFNPYAKAMRKKLIKTLVLVSREIPEK